MTDDHPDTADESIAVKRDRLETIISQLEDGDVSLERATELHAEGEALLDDLEDDLDIGDGDVIEKA